MKLFLFVTVLLYKFQNFTSAIFETSSDPATPLNLKYDSSDDAINDYLNNGIMFQLHRNTKRDSSQIENNRRSSLDKNFMRFGRSDKSLMRFGRDNSANYNKNLMRLGRSDKSLMRFGRSDGWMRFGRSDKSVDRENIFDYNSSDDNDGKGMDKISIPNVKENDKNLMRFGRADNGFMRFGKSDPSSNRPGSGFIRFGRAPLEKSKELNGKDRLLEILRNNQKPTDSPLYNDKYLYEPDYFLEDI